MAAKVAVLVDVCFPALSMLTKEVKVALTVDEQANVSKLSQQLSQHLSSLNTSSTVTVNKIRWQGSECKADSKLSLYLGLMPTAAKGSASVMFTAAACAVLNSSNCKLNVIDTVSTGGAPSSFLLDVGSPYITVGELKATLHDKLPGLDLTKSTIWHKNFKLTEETKYLSQYYIQDTARPQDIIIKPSANTRGGTIAFADISNPQALKTLEWNDSAPKWRFAVQGLNVEGCCRNSSCKAARRMVISTVHGLHSPCHHFDVVAQANQCPCPCCGEPTQIDTCAFTGCEWRFWGVKVLDGKLHVLERSDWRTAGDKYERFEGSSANNLATWDRLMIITRPVPGGDPPPTCEACGEPVLGLGRLHGAGTELPCGHTLHAACMVSSFAAQCPACTLSEQVCLAGESEMEPSEASTAASAAAASTAASACGTGTSTPNAFVTGSLANSLAAGPDSMKPEALIPLLEALKGALDPALTHLKGLTTGDK